MEFSKVKPCGDCPFLREGGIRIAASRVREIAGMMESPDGGTFVCHKTSGRPREFHCAGALAYAQNRGNETQAMRIADRVGLFDPEAISRGVRDAVFGDMQEMLATAWER